ncbi:MAG TPA: CRISPR-associated endonuclease Cas3'' [Trebonia sp.]|nr:CRISPR-associated endonuclease Cas3'' [Trebonia sp.]
MGSPGSFDGFFRAATGRAPHAELERVARDGLAEALPAPGADRAAVILAWLWRRLGDEHGIDGQGNPVPRRLLYVLPQRGLAEPAAARTRAWLENLGLADQVALHVPMGAYALSRGDWRQDMHRPAIIIGTADVLLSKALLRPYGTGRVLAPIDFALVTNGAQWIVAHPELCPASAATLRGIARLAAESGTAEPFALTEIHERYPAERPEPSPPEPPSAARPGESTVIVLPTVSDAQGAYRDLRRGESAGVTLVHAQFRGIERAGLAADLAARPENRTVVTTAPGAASLDLPAEVLWVGLPPAGAVGARRVTGSAALDHAALGSLFDTAPAEGADIDITPYACDEDDPDAEVAWASWNPAPNGSGPAGAPSPEVRPPSAEYRCRVPLSRIPELAAGRPVWRWDPETESYARTGVPGEPPVRPYEVLLVDAADGGYDPETGFDPAARGSVPGCPVLLTPAELQALAAAALEADVSEADVCGADVREGKAGDTGGGADEPGAAERKWQSLDEHSAQVRDQAAALLRVLVPAVSAQARQSVVTAGYLHDCGKAHPVWQDALCALATAADAPMVADGRPWAKSGGPGQPLEFAGGVPFRHELASLLLIDGPLRHLLDEAPDRDLARYGVLAHHGKLRVRVPDDEPVPPAAGPTMAPATAPSAPRMIRGLVDGVAVAIPPLLSQPPARLTVDLSQFGDSDGGSSSWTKTVRALLDRYGPFRLAYLETVVRMADWRASAGAELPAAASLRDRETSVQASGIRGGSIRPDAVAAIR